MTPLEASSSGESTWKTSPLCVTACPNRPQETRAPQLCPLLSGQQNCSPAPPTPESHPPHLGLSACPPPNPHPPNPGIPGSNGRPCRTDVQGRRMTDLGALPSSLGPQGKRGTDLRGVCSPPINPTPTRSQRGSRSQAGAPSVHWPDKREGRGQGPGDADRPAPAWRGSPCSWRRPWSR